MEVILRRYFDISRITSEGCNILIEDRSTNCGSNAIETRKVLEASCIPHPATCIIIQDPTMVMRTIASFGKAYDDVPNPPRFLGCPIFVPRMREVAGELQYDQPEVRDADLWPRQRFYELLVGEIPRLRDDTHGYGPRGKGFITHVGVPREVEEAWERINQTFGVSR